jgi:ribulose-5-phosphate 4-epimerase/fuculose-1-phosphate aldolase
VHLHCTHCVAVSCLEGFSGLPPITAYYAMRIRSLGLIPYYRPGDRALAEAVREKAAKHHAVLLANHGPVVAGKSLEDAVYNAEELEETAKLYLLLEGRRTRFLDPAQIADLEKNFPS